MAPSPTRFASNVAFVSFSTLVLALFGASAGGGLEETPFLETLPAWGVAAFGVWMAAISFVALVLPLLALAVWGRHPDIRRALLPYVLAHELAPILTEVLFMRVFVPNIVVFTGLVYTSYRLWQLWSSRRFFSRVENLLSTRGRAVRGLLSLGLVFWTGNLLFLALISLPRVLEP